MHACMRACMHVLRVLVEPLRSVSCCDLHMCVFVSCGVGAAQPVLRVLGMMRVRVGHLQPVSCSDWRVRVSMSCLPGPVYIYTYVYMYKCIFIYICTYICI